VLHLHRARVCAQLLALSVMASGTAMPAMAATVTVTADGDLQGALNSAQPGDVILLAPGATYTGNFKLPLKGDGGFITISTGAGATALPAAGVRTGPQYASVLAKIKSPNSAPALATVDGAHHWRVENVEFLATLNGSGDIITLGSASQTVLSQMPHDLVFDRVYIHGDPVLGQKRGIALQSGATEIVNSYIADIKSKGQDAQAICGWNGSGPYLIENNYLEASGEHVMFGGADPAIPNLVPSDITVRRNLFSKPMAWLAEKWSVKNIFELKNARRVLIEGNVFENVWPSGQVGFAIVFTPRNQSGKAPWSVVEDVTFRYNIVRNAGGGINLTGWDDEAQSAQTQRVQIAHNLFYDINASTGGSGIFLQIGNNPRSVVVEHNTVVQTGAAINVYGKKAGAPWPVDGFIFRNNLMRHNTYGVMGDNQSPGQVTLNAYFLGLQFERNVLAGGQASLYPASNYFPTVSDFDAAFVNPAAGDFTLVSTTPLKGWASDGGPVGADIGLVKTAINSSVAGTAQTVPSTPGAWPANTAPDSGRTAVCRTGRNCGVR
jgi:hypothetical protein